MEERPWEWGAYPRQGRVLGTGEAQCPALKVCIVFDAALSARHAVDLVQRVCGNVNRAKRLFPPLRKPAASHYRGDWPVWPPRPIFLSWPLQTDAASSSRAKKWLSQWARLRASGHESLLVGLVAGGRQAQRETRFPMMTYLEAIAAQAGATFFGNYPNYEDNSHARDAKQHHPHKDTRRNRVFGQLIHLVVVTLRGQAQPARAHVKGPHFIGRHELFDQVVEPLELFTDDVARVTADSL